MSLNNIKKLNSRGFTIVELLVVIVVIGVLAAVTTVSYSGVTAKANTSANQSNANNVLKAANGVYAEFGRYPTPDASAATMNTNLNEGLSKISATVTVTSTTVTSGTATNLSYRRTVSGTGICVGYWDYTGTPAAKYYFSGTATADNGTICS